jgi:hypothetical protein
MRREESAAEMSLGEGGSVRAIQAEIERPDGAPASITISSAPPRDAEGRVGGAATSMIEAPDQTSDAIEIQRLAAIVDGSDDAIIGKTLDGVVTSWNSGAARIFGYTSQEMVGQPIACLIPADLHGEEMGILAKLKRGERVDHYDTIRLARNGRLIAVSLTVSPLRDATGRIVGASKIARDITERKRADELRDQLVAQLTAANEERTHFAYAASHDLRTPLRMVTAFCERMSRDYSDRLDEGSAEYLSLALAATTRMSRMLDDLIDFNRLAVGARGSWFDADRALDGALENFVEAIRAGATITRDPLPRIFGNPIQVERLMQNLIGNSLKYVAEGVNPRIHVSATRDGEFCRISVKDNGIGIAPRYWDRIFEPFKRLHGNTRYAGTGLGLSICRKIVEGWGGALSVRSTEGEGSIFSFTAKIECEENDIAASDA